MPALGRRTLLSAAAATAAGGLLSACGSPPGRSQRLLTVIAETGSLLTRNFSPFVPNARWAALYVLHEPLMVWNMARGKLEPQLATGYRWSDGNRTLTLAMRPGVRWSDGRPCTAHDAAFTLDLIRRTKGLIGRAAPALGDVDTITAPDAGTLRITFKRVNTPALYDLVGQAVVPRHIWGKIDDPLRFANPKPVGTGPFRVTQFRPQGYEMHRNPLYWQKIHIPGLQLSGWSGNDQINNATVSGAVDWGALIPNPDRTFVRRDPEHFGYWWPHQTDVQLFLNTTTAPFDDPAVRRALAPAFDRRRMVDIAVWGKSVPANPVGLPDGAYPGWFDADTLHSGAKLTAYDPKAAEHALDTAGLRRRGGHGMRADRSGKPVRFDIIVPAGWTDFVSVARIAADNLRAVGIDARMRTTSFDSWSQSVYGGDFQACISAGEIGATPYNYFRAMMSKATKAPKGQAATLNFHRLADPEADRLLTAWAAVSERKEQQDIARRLARRFVTLMPAIPLYEQPEWGAYNTQRYTGFPTAENPYAPLRPVSRFPSTFLVFPHLRTA
ncbi:MAG: ABC transporter substrate-binding protein [Kitasatospora sp.]|jgi:peptide/nickel transport system substrate-binding protein|nr:ABC transporter substrate-binding protein [Kitasatospora sp.]